MQIISILLISTVIKGLQSMHNFADVPCGRRKTSGRIGKVIGGENAIEGEFPWLVSLTRRGAHFCGGSLLTKKYILTAGHCICSGSELISPNQMKVTIGQHDLTKPSSNKYEMTIKSITMHPNYNCKKVRNDLAVLELEEELEWSEFCKPACLPSQVGGDSYQRFGDVLATVAGWGWTNEKNKNGANTLQKASVNILDNEKCQQWYKSQGKKTKIQNTQLCAGYETGGVDSCWADSGGPLMVASEIQDQVMVVGVVSTGIGCARPFLPGLYTRVSEYIPWIRSVVQA